MTARNARADDPRHHQILVLHSYHLGYVWTSGIHEALLAALREAKLDVDVRTEYLDWKHFPTEENLERQYNNLRNKYSNLRFDLVVTSDNKATEFVLERRRTLFADTPMVFCGYNGFRPGLLAGQSRVTGVAEFVDAVGTLKLALALAPKTQQVFAVCDRTETGRAVCNEVKEAVGHFQRKIKIIFIGERESTEEVLSALRVTAPNSLVLAGPFNQDREGRFLDLWELADLIRSREINVPVFHLYQEALGHGVVGGSMMSGALQGRAAGQLAARILRGESPDGIAVITARTVAKYVDFKEVERFGLEAENIPFAATLLNPPKTFYEQHRGLIIGGLGVSLCALLGVTVLLIFRVQSERVAKRNAEQLRALIQNMPVLACAFDEQDNVVMWNRACEAVLGFSAHEVRSLGARESLTFQENSWRNLVALARANITQVALELEHKDKMGQSHIVRWFSESSRSPVPGWAGWVVGVDTSELRFSEAERTRLALAVSQTSEGIVILDAQTVIHYANNAAVSLLEKKRDQILGQTWQNVLGNDKDVTCIIQARHWSHGAQPLHGILHVVVNDSQVRSIDCTVSPLLVPGDEQLGSVVVLRDVTEQLVVEERLRQAQRMDSLGELAFGVAHDFGNLLTTIIGNAGLLTESKEPKLQDECAIAIENAASRGIALVKQLKGFARAESIAMTVVDVHAVIDELRTMLERTLLSSIRLNFEMRAPNTHIRGNSGQLIQVLLNLSINARDAMPKGGTLSFITSSSQGQFALWVKDTGIGMPREVMQKIFNPFFSTKPIGIGSGMGLATAYSIVKSHGGVIEVTSEVGVGTTFQLRFPLIEERWSS